LSAPKVVVVGGGVIGTACAYYLAKGGASVVLLERERLGAGASEGNAGCISPGHPPLNRPGRVAKALRQMLDPTSPLYVRPGWNPGLWRWLAGFARYCTDAHVETAMRVMAPLGKRSMVLFDELIREEKLECEYRADGYYEISSSEAGL
jgi:D-amino-acid dehydrogenase